MRYGLDFVSIGAIILGLIFVGAALYLGVVNGMMGSMPFLVVGIAVVAIGAFLLKD